MSWLCYEAQVLFSFIYIASFSIFTLMDDSIKFSRFCLILNIPALYRSCHLRDYFHYLVEREAFCCFHYKHRKQKLGVKHEDNAEELDVQRQPYQVGFCICHFKYF